MNHLERAYKAFTTNKVDRWHRDAPKEPVKPREPRPMFSKMEKLSGDSFTSTRPLSELVDEALIKAGLDPERLDPEVRAALERASVDATRDSCDDSPYLQLDWEVLTPNPLYDAERAVFLTEMMAYEKACEEYADKAEAYAAKAAEGRRLVEEMRERAEYDRLKDKFEKKGT